MRPCMSWTKIASAAWSSSTAFSRIFRDGRGGVAFTQTQKTKKLAFRSATKRATTSQELDRIFRESRRGEGGASTVERYPEPMRKSAGTGRFGRGEASLPSLRKDFALFRSRRRQSVMTVVAAILRSRLVREDAVVDHVVGKYPVAVRIDTDDEVWASQIAQQRIDGNVHHVVAKPPAIGPSPWNHSLAKALLDLALESVSAEDAQT